MMSIRDLPSKEQLALKALKSEIEKAFPGRCFRLTLFGSKARGDADPESDVDILVEVDTPRIPPDDKRILRHIAGRISIESGVLLCLLVVDQNTLERRGDYAIFQNIREEGIAL